MTGPGFWRGGLVFPALRHEYGVEKDGAIEVTCHDVDHENASAFIML